MGTHQLCGLIPIGLHENNFNLELETSTGCIVFMSPCQDGSFGGVDGCMFIESLVLGPVSVWQTYCTQYPFSMAHMTYYDIITKASPEDRRTQLANEVRCIKGGVGVGRGPKWLQNQYTSQTHILHPTRQFLRGPLFHSLPVLGALRLEPHWGCWAGPRLAADLDRSVRHIMR